MHHANHHAPRVLTSATLRERRDDRGDLTRTNILEIERPAQPAPLARLLPERDPRAGDGVEISSHGAGRGAMAFGQRVEIAPAAGAQVGQQVEHAGELVVSPPCRPLAAPATDFDITLPLASRWLRDS